MFSLKQGETKTSHGPIPHPLTAPPFFYMPLYQNRLGPEFSRQESTISYYKLLVSPEAHFPGSAKCLAYAFVVCFCFCFILFICLFVCLFCFCFKRDYPSLNESRIDLVVCSLGIYNEYRHIL